MNTNTQPQSIRELTGTWRIEPRELVSTVTVKHRSGPVAYVARLRLADGLVEVGPGARVRFDLTLADDDLGATSHRDPRWNDGLLASAAGATLRFDSTAIAEAAPGLTEVTGVLVRDRRRREITLVLRTTWRDGVPELVVTAEADHRELGLHWLPTAPLKAPTQIAVRARLAAQASSVSRKAGALDRRYRFMANGA